MELIYLLLLLAGLACFAFAALSARQPARPNLVALGLAFWILVPLIQHLRALS